MGISPQERIARLEFVAFDTETTGASALADALVEVGAVRFSLEKGPISYFQTLVHPRRPIPPFVTGIHGITDAMVAKAPTTEQVLPHFFRFIAGAVPVAHNARFDIDFIAVPAMRHSLELPETVVLDSCRFARRALKGLPSYSLKNLTLSLAIEAATYHRALADAVSCMEVFRIAVEKSAGFAGTWEELMKAHGPAPEFHKALKPVDDLDEKLSPLVDAIRSRRRITIEYAGGFGAREITPLSLYAKGSGQYLEATCHLDEMRKTFRLDRIQKIF